MCKRKMKSQVSRRSSEQTATQRTHQIYRGQGHGQQGDHGDDDIRQYFTAHTTRQWKEEYKVHVDHLHDMQVGGYQ